MNGKAKEKNVTVASVESKAVKVTLKPGVFPADVLALEKKIRGGRFTLEEVRQCQKKQWDYAGALLNRPLSQSFSVEPIKDFHWQADAYEHLGPRGDTINKNIGKQQ